MTREDLALADEAVLRIIIEQGEKHLSSQCEFANAQDERGGAVINAAAALAAAAVAVSAGAASLSQPQPALAWAAAVCAVGFCSAAGVAVWAHRSRGFHACGFFPNDFAKDVHERRSERDLLVDFALELQIRLTHNGKVLMQRGRISNASTWLLLASPIVALLAGLLVA